MMKQRKTRHEVLEADIIMRKKNTTSIAKYVILSFLTFGFYELIWMYKTWEYIGSEFDWDLNSAKRTVFSVFYMGSLSWHINRLNKKDKKANIIISISFGITYILTQVLSVGFENYFLRFITIIPILPLLITVNKLRSGKGNL